MSIGVAELKARLSAYLDKVKGGEEVLVTEHGRPVARLVPVYSNDERRDARLQRLARAGAVQLARGPVPADVRRPPAPVRSVGVLDALLDERDDGR
jgi:prevent-host-death family protein